MFYVGKRNIEKYFYWIMGIFLHKILNMNTKESNFDELIKFFREDFFSVLSLIWNNVLLAAFVDQIDGSGTYLPKGIRYFKESQEKLKSLSTFNSRIFKDEEVCRDFLNSITLYSHKGRRGYYYYHMSSASRMIIFENNMYEEGFEHVFNDDEDVRNAVLKWVCKVNAESISQMIRFMIPLIKKTSETIDEDLMDQILEEGFQNIDYDKYIDYMLYEENSMKRSMMKEIFDHYYNSEEMKVMKKELMKGIFGNEEN